MKYNFFISWPLIFLVVALGCTFVLWRQSDSLEELHLRHTKAELHARARLLARECARDLAAGDLPAIAALLSNESRATGTRITLIASDGAVLADSDEPAGKMENHRQRPEVMEALETPAREATSPGEWASSVRYSTTSGRKMIFTALPFEVGGERYVIRTALSIHAFDQLLHRARQDVVLAMLFTALLVLCACYFLYRTVTRPARVLSQAAARIADGTLDLRLPVPERGAIRELGDSVNRMAEELKSRIHEISSEKSVRDAAFSALSEGVVVLDVEEVILDANQAARRIFQWRGDPVGSALPEVVRSGSLRRFLARLRASGEPEQEELTLSLPDGDRQLRVRGSVLKLSGSVRTGYLLVFYDLTQLRKLENFRRDFVANVSHEIKTPLTAIRGAVETLQDGAIAEPESAARFMEIIRMHAKRLNNLVQDILSLSALECRAAEEECRLLPGDLASVAASAIRLEQQRAGAAGIKIGLSVGANPGELLDHQLMEQAVVNLLGNALNHSGEIALIQVRIGEDHTVADRPMAVLEVTDHGCGIAPEHAARLFERFYRVDKARSRKAGGTGLGLAIVKHIMHLHQGTAEVRSTPGQGATFLLRLPVCSDPDHI